MSPAAVLRRRRAIRDYAETLRTNRLLISAGADLRRQAQAQAQSGHPELARPYLDEAELFEGAALPLPSL